MNFDSQTASVCQIKRSPYFFVLYLTSLLLTPTTTLSDRSVHHPTKNIQRIEVRWSETSPLTGERQDNGEAPLQTHQLTSSFLEEWAIFHRFDLKFHLENQLPEKIAYRNHPEKTVARQELNRLMNGFITELLKKKRSSDNFTNFKILKDDDFNYKRGCGIIIVKFKDYPFVLKLLRETPETFVKPFSKGIVPIFIFASGGGINRFLSGFTRIPNLHVITQKIAADPRWAPIVSAPRKWFWTPEHVNWFTITGFNFRPTPITATFPSTYGIVCDEIVAERTLCISNKADRRLALDLAHFIGDRIDSHICNFMIEKETGKIVFIDTEHFASMVGLKEPLEFKSYTMWYLKLSNNCLKRALFRSRETREREASGVPENLVLMPNRPQAT